MLQEVAEIFLPLGSGNKADGAVKCGVQAILLKREKFTRSISKVDVSSAKFQVHLECGRALDETAEQGCAVDCRAVCSCLLLLRNLTSNPFPLLDHNIF